MPVALNSQLGSKEQADAQLAQAIMSAMRVSMPGIIQSFDPDAVTAVVQPAIKGAEKDESGCPGIGKPPTAGGRSCRFPSWRRLYADFSC